MIESEAESGIVAHVLIRRSLALLDRWQNAPQLVQRFYVFVLGIVALGTVMSVNHRFGQHYDPVDAFSMVLLLAAALWMFMACTVPPIAQRMMRQSGRLVVLTVAVSGIVLAAHSFGQLSTLVQRFPSHAPYGNDAVTMSACATRLFLHGKNPYPSADLITCMWEHGYYKDGNLTTPLQQGAFAHITIYPKKSDLDRQLAKIGYSTNDVYKHRPAEFESQISYPAGSFLVPAPFAWAGGDLRQFFVLCFLASYALAMWWTPGIGRFLIGIAGVINMPVWANAVSGASDAMYMLFMMISWRFYRREGLSSVAMALAVTSRQQAWFFLIFYAVLIWRVSGWESLWRRGLIIVSLFILTNLPFAMNTPLDWWNGIWSPLKDPMFPLGSGIIVLSAAGVVPLWPRTIYLLAELATMAVSLVWYWRHCRRWPYAGLVLAVLPFFFAWRSLFSYFYPISVALLGVLAAVDEPVALLVVAPQSGRERLRARVTRARARSHARPAWPLVAMMWRLFSMHPDITPTPSSRPQRRAG